MLERNKSYQKGIGITMKRIQICFLLLVIVGALSLTLIGGHSVAAAQPSYDITTLAGKVASIYGTAGLTLRFSAFLEEEAEVEKVNLAPGAPPITPTFVLSSPLDGSSILAPARTVNLDTAGAPQNE